MVNLFTSFLNKNVEKTQSNLNNGTLKTTNFMSSEQTTDVFSNILNSLNTKLKQTEEKVNNFVNNNKENTFEKRQNEFISKNQDNKQVVEKNDKISPETSVKTREKTDLNKKGNTKKQEDKSGMNSDLSERSKNTKDNVSKENISEVLKVDDTKNDLKIENDKNSATKNNEEIVILNEITNENIEINVDKILDNSLLDSNQQKDTEIVDLDTNATTLELPKEDVSDVSVIAEPKLENINVLSKDLNTNLDLSYLDKNNFAQQNLLNLEVDKNIIANQNLIEDTENNISITNEIVDNENIVNTTILDDKSFIELDKNFWNLETENNEFSMFEIQQDTVVSDEMLTINTQKENLLEGNNNLTSELEQQTPTQNTLDNELVNKNFEKLNSNFSKEIENLEINEVPQENIDTEKVVEKNITSANEITSKNDISNQVENIDDDISEITIDKSNQENMKVDLKEEKIAENPLKPHENIANSDFLDVGQQNNSNNNPQKAPDENIKLSVDNLGEKNTFLSSDKNIIFNKILDSTNNIQKNVLKTNVLNQINENLPKLSQANTKVNMIVQPENLGKISIELQSGKDGMIAKFVATSNEVKTMLEQNLDSLKNNLASQGVNVNNIVVKLEETASLSNNMFNFENGNFEQQNFANSQNSSKKAYQNNNEEQEALLNQNEDLIEENEKENSVSPLLSSGNSVDYRI